MERLNKKYFHPIFNHFLDTDLENQYADRAISNVIKMLTFSIGFLTLNIILLVFSDFQFTSFNAKDAEVVSLTRILVIFISFIVMVAINFVRKYDFVNNVLLFYLVLIAYLNFMVHSYHPSAKDINYSIELVTVLGIYLIFPIKIKYQIIGALTFTISNYASLSKGLLSTDNNYLIILMFVSTNFMGYVLSTVFNRTARRLFYRYNNEKLLRKKIKSTLRDIEIIQELIPICSSCKKIRNDSGYWSQVDDYMNKISNAEFIRDECPNCKGAHE